jgi:hypothetical protein
MCLVEADQLLLGIDMMDYFGTNRIAQSSNHKCQYMFHRIQCRKNDVLIVNMYLDRKL